MKKVVLLCVGSFNPITFMHIRMFVLAKEYLYNKLQWQVLGGLVSPVHDAYRKKGLVSAEHRVNMVKISLNDYKVPWIKLSEWETKQVDWQRTLESLEYHRQMVNSQPEEWFPELAGGSEKQDIQVMLLCGSDVLQSFSVPGLWSESQVDTILNNHGVVCVTRAGSAVEDVIRCSPRLSKARDSVIIVPEWFENNVSSTSIRNAVQEGRCIGMLVTMSVVDYIREHRLYLDDETQPKTLPVLFMFKAISSVGHGDAYEQALKEAGWNVVQIPVINFQYLGVPELQNALFRPEQYSGLILTSPRGVEALALAAKGNENAWKDTHCPAWNTKSVYAIGEGTAAVARALGLVPTETEAGSEKALGEIIAGRKEQHTERLLFPCGNLRLESLRNILDEKGIFVEYIESYETSAHPQLVSLVQQALQSQGFPDAVLFFSPSGIQFMDEILRQESLAFKQTKYAAIGPTTAEAMRTLGYAVDAVAEKPEPQSAVKALAACRPK
ncbi:uncharacterized protein LOC129584544 [Paramacrobiotus metropolitanus]|uniref:uncharacterized protein LOC129584544 n=1 Tax=Paramacrobiotus metropolitanus TaxID=2943436 RepID=UPI002445FE04|nr:uncharacterized protein LOC129584544 [Paramacrobiotus metropolitanus]